MNDAEFRSRLSTVAFTAGMNSRYHQKIEWWWGAADKAVRIMVGFLTVLSVLVLPDYWPLVVTWSAVAFAVVLNVIPLAEWQKDHAEMFRLWSDLRKDAVQLTLRTAETIFPHHIERLQDLLDEENALHASETAPWEWLLKRCQEDETQSIWGKGVRTPEQVEREQARRRLTSGAAAGAVVVDK